MSNIQFDCTECGHKLKVDISAAGKKVPCPICKTKIRIPRESEDKYRPRAKTR